MVFVSDISCNFKKDIPALHDYCEGKCLENDFGPDGWCNLKIKKCFCGDINAFTLISTPAYSDEKNTWWKKIINDSHVDLIDITKTNEEYVKLILRKMYENLLNLFNKKKKKITLLQVFWCSWVTICSNTNFNDMKWSNTCHHNPIQFQVLIILSASMLYKSYMEHEAIKRSLHLSSQPIINESKVLCVLTLNFSVYIYINIIE